MAIAIGFLGLAAIPASATTIPKRYLPFTAVRHFGDYGNASGPLVGDCMFAAEADLLQMDTTHHREFPTAPIVASYLALAPGNAGIGNDQLMPVLETTPVASHVVTSATPVAYGLEGFPQTTEPVTQATIESGVVQYGGLFAMIIIPKGIGPQWIGGLGVPLAQQTTEGGLGPFDRPSNKISTAWTLQNTPNAEVVGGSGHDVAIVGYSPSWAYIVSWGDVFRVAWSWLEANTYEAWGLTF